MTLQEKPKKRITVLAFQVCLIANNVLGADPQLYTLSKLIMLVFFGIMLLDIFRQRGAVKLGRLLLLPALFVLWNVVSYFWAYNQSVAFSQLVTQLQLYVLLVFVYVVMRNDGTVKDYLDAVYISGFGMALFALFRYGGLEAYIDVMQEGTRMGSGIANPNVYGMVFSGAAIAAAYYTIIKKKPLHMVSIAIFAFFALSSGSKKATLMIIAGVLFLALFYNGIKKLHKTVVIVVVAAAVFWMALQLPIFETIRMRLESFFTGEGNTTSDNIRRSMVSVGWELFLEQPVFGYGLSNYQILSAMGSYSHNNFIELLVSLGFVGTALYYLMYLVPACMLFLGRDRKQIWKDGLMIALLVWIVIDLIFGWGYVQAYEKSPYFLIGACLGIAEQQCCRSPETQEGARKTA